MNTLSISINGQYLISNEKIYFVNENKSYPLDSLSVPKIIDILNENTQFSVRNNLIDINELISYQRRITYQILEYFDLDSKTKLMLEYESKFKNLILENTQLVENWLTDAWNWTKEKAVATGGWITNQVKDLGGFAIKMGKDLVTCLTNGGCSPFFEDFRTVLFNPASMAIETFLTATGIGHIGVVVCWGVLLLWDIYTMITDYANFSWMNLIFDILGIGGLELLGKALKGMGIVGKTGEEIITAGMKNPKSAGIFMKLKGLLTSGLAGITNILRQAGTFLTEKLGFKWVGQALNKFSEVVAKLLEKLNVNVSNKTVNKLVNKGITATKGEILRNGVKSGLKTGAIAQGVMTGTQSNTGKDLVDRIGGGIRNLFGMSSSEDELINLLGAPTDGQFVQGRDY